ncbi:MAG: PD-(D/E)XK nuclease family protein [Alphaproteobacteria bacterium]|nr:PD-(D/E)XK nuclease family protein [Alphaproteobacteria bacterium]
MASNKNIFFPTNPAHTLDALWHIISSSNVPLSDILIFLPSRRAIRSVEQMLAQKHGGAVMLPELIALGEGVDEFELETSEITDDDTISNTERIVILAKLLSADKHIGNVATALPIARDLVRMTDYLENEGIDISTIDWANIIGEQYATHFHDKAKILQILSNNSDAITHGKQTVSAKRNADIRAWVPYINSQNFPYKLVIVCGSTASVPATADLMVAVSESKIGRIILSGKIDGRTQDFDLTTNPYYSEYKFLTRIGCDVADIIPIDVGVSDTIDFMNAAFGNDPTRPQNTNAINHCHLVECERESIEASTVAEIAARAIADKKSVLVITPDAAGNQRIAAELAARNIDADFSGGRPATTHVIGRAILNLFDDWIENKPHEFDKLYDATEHNLFETLLQIVDSNDFVFAPPFDISDKNTISIWLALRNLSDALSNNDIVLSVSDARAFIADTLASVTMRSNISDVPPVCVLGTIESRMQTADVVILTGLNEGMFPSTGYENAWLPRKVSEQLGLPSPNRKVSLMSLDFMNLSCGGDVYWLRSKISGGVQTTESRFLSRVAARGGNFDTELQHEILSAVLARDNVQPRPLDYTPPTPPADWSDVYVTDLEYLIHNPYAYYVRHILYLRVIDDYWVGPDARTFGTLVHKAIEQMTPNDTAETLVAKMDTAAQEKLGPAHILFHFWHKRFLEIAPVIINEFSTCPNAHAEIPGVVQISGRNIRARADRVDDGIVIDIKTGSAPTKSQLLAGTMPQLPLEAYMLQSGGFHIKTTDRSKAPTMTFLQLHNNDARPISYDAETTAQMIRAAVEKTKSLIETFTFGRAPYQNLPNSERTYRIYDDFARAYDDV